MCADSCLFGRGVRRFDSIVDVLLLFGDCEGDGGGSGRLNFRPNSLRTAAAAAAAAARRGGRLEDGGSGVQSVDASGDANRTRRR